MNRIDPKTIGFHLILILYFNEVKSLESRDKLEILIFQEVFITFKFVDE